jgi:hypothetical protein
MYRVMRMCTTVEHAVVRRILLHLRDKSVTVQKKPQRLLYDARNMATKGVNPCIDMGLHLNTCGSTEHHVNFRLHLDWYDVFEGTLYFELYE